MPNLWSLLRGRGDTLTRYSLSDYAEDIRLAYGGFGYPLGSGGSAWLKAENIENSFAGYVASAFKSDGVVFATILSRMLLFTEARFQWQRVNNGRPGDLFGTPDLGVLEAPWPNGTTGELLGRMELDVSLAGNFYAVREEDRLRRLRPDWTTIVLSAPPAEAAKSDVVGYWYHPGRVYGNVGDPQPSDEVYLPDEVCHWSPIPDPDAQYRGMSWLTPILREIMADKAATLHKLKFFENGAVLGPIVRMPAEITADQFRDFIAEMNAAHEGVENAYKTMYVGGGADVTLSVADLRQLDFKATQGAGETRICAAGGVPAVIVGLSEGLQAATYSNFGQARRKFGDHWARPQWRSACAALQSLLPLPAGATAGTVRLWYDDRDIAFLREDQADAATIAFTEAQTIRQLVDAGYLPDSVTKAVLAGDFSLLQHSGLYSVQLLPPTSVEHLPIRQELSKLGKEADAPPAEQAAAEQAAAAEGTASRAVIERKHRAFDPTEPRDPHSGKWIHGAGALSHEVLNFRNGDAHVASRGDGGVLLDFGHTHTDLDQNSSEEFMSALQRADRLRVGGIHSAAHYDRNAGPHAEPLGSVQIKRTGEDSYEVEGLHGEEKPLVVTHAEALRLNDAIDRANSTRTTKTKAGPFSVTVDPDKNVDLTLPATGGKSTKVRVAPAELVQLYTVLGGLGPDDPESSAEHPATRETLRLGGMQVHVTAWGDRDHNTDAYRLESDDGSWTLQVKQKDIGAIHHAIEGAVESVGANVGDETLRAAIVEQAELRRAAALTRLITQTRALRADLHPGDAEQLHAYWTHGAGLAKWADSPKPWTTLHGFLAEYIHNPDELDRTTSQWFKEVFGYSAGSDLNRVAHGHPPRGNRVGPG